MNAKAFMIVANGIEYLNDIAISDNDGTRWEKSTTENYFDTTLYYGTAGVAFTLTELSAFTNAFIFSALSFQLISKPFLGLLNFPK